MSETVPCRCCDGTGQIELGRCIAYTGKGRCRRLARNDPEYFELYPDRADLKPYCGMHGNERVRERMGLEP